MRLDGTLVQTANDPMTPGNFYNINFAVVHPLPAPDQDWVQSIQATGTYVIGNSWGPSSQSMVDNHKNILRQNIANGGSPGAENVLGESLSMYWYMHRAQASNIEAIYDQIGTAQHFWYHYVGVIGYNNNTSSPYFDVGGLSFDVVSRKGVTSVESKMIAATDLLNNGLEASVLQQNLDVQGINPMQMLRAAASGTIWDATSSNWSTVNAALVDWQDSDPALDVQISQGSRLIIHQDGSTSIGDFTGGGWYEKTSSGAILPWMQGELSSSIARTAVPTRIWSYFEVWQLELQSYSGPSGNPPCTPNTPINPVRTWYGYCWLDDPPKINSVPWGAPQCPNIMVESIAWPPVVDKMQDIMIVQALWDKGKVFLYPIGRRSGGSTSAAVSTSETNAGAEDSPSSTTVGDQGAGHPPCACDPISLQSGNYFYDRTDLTVGSGAYPYSLSFARSYDASARFKDGPLGLGWTHNLATRVTAGSNGMRGCGGYSAKEAASAIAHAYLMLQLDVANSDLLDFLIGAITTMWLMDQLTNNAVELHTGAEDRTFIKLIDGTYNPPPGYADALIKNVDGTFTLKDPQQRSWNFNLAGNLATYVDPAGVTVTYGYDGSNRVITVSNGLGRTITLTYSGSRLASVSDGNGRQVSFTIDGNKNQTTFTDTEGKAITYAYGLPGQLAQIFLPANPSTAYVSNVYDSLNRIKEQTPANEGTTQYFFAGSRAKTIGPLGNSRIMFYNRIGSLVKNIDALGNATLYQRDGLNRETKITYPEGNSTELEYDQKNNVTKITAKAKPGSGLADIVQEFTFNSTWNKVTTAKDGEGNITNFSYHATQGVLIQITRPTIGGQTPTIGFTHNSRGQVLTVTDETGIVDKADYSATNETLTSWTRDFGTGRLNLVTGFGYNNWGDISSITDPRNNTTTFLTDKERRLTKRTECAPFNFETFWEWDDNGNQKKVKRQTGDVTHPFQEWQFQYSVHNDLKKIIDPSNNPLDFAYNLNRWLTSRTDAEGRQWQFQYDELGRISVVIDPIGNHSETRTYTDNGMLASIKDARMNTTNMQYDGFDRLFKRIYPDSTFEQFGYNKNNQVLTLVTRRGDTITNTYDVLTRLATRDPGPLPLQTMGYDLAGRLTSVSTPVVAGDPGSGNFQFGYDTAGRLIIQTMPDGKTVTYQLDANGNRTRLTWPDAYFAEYVFDELNRLTNIKLNGNPLSAIVIGYDQLSRRTSLTYINGCSASYGYEWNNDLASLIHNFVGSAVNFTMVYNKVHQLKTLLVDDAALLWTPTAAKTTPYAAANNLNQYPSVDGTALSYDNNGNLTASGFMNSANYDALNRLTQVVTVSTTNNYWLDPLNRQAQKGVNGTKTQYLYDGPQLIGEYNVATGNIFNRYIPTNILDEVLIQNAVTVVPPLPPVDVSAYLHRDRLSSVIGLSNASGQIQQKYAYAPFGETPSLTGTIFGFTGQRFDAETGLYFYKSRYYSPTVGRFLQPDPAGYYAGDLNLYAYVGNDSPNLRDPLGLQATCCGLNPGGFDPYKNLGPKWNPDYNWGDEDPTDYQCFHYALGPRVFEGTRILQPGEPVHRFSDVQIYRNAKGQPSHFAVVTDIDPNTGGPLRVQGKLGAGEVVSHHPQDPSLINQFGPPAEIVRITDPAKYGQRLFTPAGTINYIDPGYPIYNPSANVQHNNGGMPVLTLPPI